MSLVDARLAQYHEQGYVILRDVLSSAEVDSLRAALQPYLDPDVNGRNNFEGERTQPVYSLVGRGADFERTAEHPAVLALLDALLHPGYLLTASQAICTQPGETPQPVHYDDTFYTLPRPRPVVSVSTIWALDDFTAANGGTEVIPGSHRWDDALVATAYKSDPDAPVDEALAAQLVPVEMPAGSLVLFAGTLLHRGGANLSRSPRLQPPVLRALGAPAGELHPLHSAPARQAHVTAAATDARLLHPPPVHGPVGGPSPREGARRGLRQFARRRRRRDRGAARAAPRRRLTPAIPAARRPRSLLTSGRPACQTPRPLERGGRIHGKAL